MNTKHGMAALALVATMILGTGVVLAADYEVDAAHSAVGFQVKHLTISKVNGSFGEVAGTFVFTEGEPDSWQAEAVRKPDAKNLSNLFNTVASLD